ncbi:hypothetical protein [Defluviimonas salinarum]|uniref:hypothetical protein n=1 Tax=Defluviimonas salinarum TaxID=2992147 RepID=UPI002232BDA0|nr:hypothetical protein [Defluviimonas salinarum]
MNSSRSLASSDADVVRLERLLDAAASGTCQEQVFLAALRKTKPGSGLSAASAARLDSLRGTFL